MNVEGTTMHHTDEQMLGLTGTPGGRWQITELDQQSP